MSRLMARSTRSHEEVELGVEVGLGDVVVDHRVGREHEAVAGQQQGAGQGVGAAGPDRAGALAGLDAVAEQLEEGLLAAAATREQVGEQQLGVELDDPDEQLVVAQPGDGVDETRGRGRRPGSLGRSARARVPATTTPHSRVIRSPRSCGMSDQAR